LFTATKKFARDNSDQVIITNADKGGKTVLVPKEEYDHQMLDLVDDKQTYKRVNYDPTNRIQTKSNSLITKLEKEGYITRTDRLKMIRHNSVPPKLYGLPKIHKLKTLDPGTREKVKLRPIASCVNSPTYNLSKFMSDILFSSSEREKFNVKNSKELLTCLKDLVIPDDYCLVSFDVTSLFTNIPSNLVLSIIEERWDSIQPYTNLDIQIFLDIMHHILTSSYFQYNNQFYRQLFGSPMGDPCSPAQADLVLDKLLDVVLNECGDKVLFLKKYVDDLILIAKRNEVNTVLESFNSFNQHLQFTMELEVERELPFLDLLIRREENGSISTKWYQKPLSSGRILNFNSFHSMTMKRNTAINLINRIVTNTSTGWCEEVERKATDILRSNQYPIHFIKKLIWNIKQPREDKPTTATPSQFRSLINIPGVTKKIENLLKKSNPELRICPKNTSTAKQLYSKLKDKELDKHQSCVIYGIPCECGRIYIGKTKQYKHQRLKQHQYSHNKIHELKAHLRTDDPKIVNELDRGTALTKHAFEENHRFEFDKMRILERGRNDRDLYLLEMLHIKAANDPVNLKTDVDNLHSIYTALK
jgi:hypothetical protein